MVNLVYKSSEHNYHLYKTDLVDNNLSEFKYQSRLGHKKYQKVFGSDKGSSTHDYDRYNLFQLTSGSVLFYNLYSQIRFVILDYLKDKTDLNFKWFNAWINYHKVNEVLDWHNHTGSYCHGYISIDPKDTTTDFENYSIKNETGLIYIGPSNTLHKVTVHTPFTDYRITVAFDVMVKETNKSMYLSYFPLV